ncbi:MAG TPA: diguanylate cyclase [Actinomycetota bacterium]|nr:diguanylate cyclase [Actinomycetota bacterium]
MRRDLTFEAANKLHRRRGHALILASIAALVVGVAASTAVAAAWGADRGDAAEARFQDVVSTQRTHVQETVRAYRRMLTVTQGFFQVQAPTNDRFLEFTQSQELAEAHRSVIALQFIHRRPGRAGGEISYPVTMVAPRSAATGLLGRDLAEDPSARDALELVGENGGVTMTPPQANTYSQLRMQLIAPVHRDGHFVGWVGATLDPSVLAGEMLAEPQEGIRATLRWDMNGDVLGSTTGTGVTDGDEPVFRSTEHVVVDGTAWSIDLVATRSFDPEALAFPWAPLAAGLVATAVVALALFMLGRSRVAALDLATRLGMDLAASEARAKAVMDSAVEAIVTTDADGHIESANPAAESLFGWTEPEMVGRPIGDIVPILDTVENEAGLHDVRWEEHEHMVEGRRKDGTALPLDVSLAATSVGGSDMFTVIARDATVRKLHEDQLEHQATHDPLTGLSNRKLFDELLVRAVFRAERSRRAIAVLYLDLDGFKDVNDVFGHQAGDRVLAETSRRLESVIRPGDIVARMGGDEFVVLCENLVSPDDAEKIATRIVRSVGKPIPVAAGVATVTASVGIAIGSLGESAASIVARADEAMYRTKQDGKAGYRFASSIIG